MAKAVIKISNNFMRNLKDGFGGIFDGGISNLLLIVATMLLLTAMLTCPSLLVAAALLLLFIWSLCC